VNLSTRDLDAARAAHLKDVTEQIQKKIANNRFHFHRELL
jgi:hypothetical protein